MMRKLIVSLLIIGVFCLVVSPAMAGSSSWGLDDPDYTHQKWKFGPAGWEEDPCDPNEQIPIPPSVPTRPDDGRWSNEPNAWPEMLSVEKGNSGGGDLGWYWTSEYPGVGDHNGMYGGPNVNVVMTFEIPNFERPEPWKKQIWIQTTYFGHTMEPHIEDPNKGGEIVSVEIAADPNFENPFDVNTISEEIEILSEEGPFGEYWYRYTAVFELDEQPVVEYVRLDIGKDSNGVTWDGLVLVDEVDIDTRCVGPAKVNYSNPWLPDWSGETGYTSQFWGLHAVDGNEPNQPLAADNYADNPYGEPNTIWEAGAPFVVWSDSPMGTHPKWVNGVYGGMADMAGNPPYDLTTTIPTGSESGALKVFVQYDWYNYGSVSAGLAGANDVTPSTYGNCEIGMSGSNHEWYRTSKVFGFDNNPGSITVTLGLAGFAPMVDSFSVTTAVDANIPKNPETYCTRQKWEFNPAGWQIDPEDPNEIIPIDPNVRMENGDVITDTNSSLVADGGYDNPFGEPNMLSVWFSQTNPNMASWTYIPMGINTGRRGMYGGMYTDVVMTFETPNGEQSGKRKQIWLQTDYFGCSASAGDVVSVEIAADPNFDNPFNVTTISENIEELAEPPGSASRWYCYTGLFELDEHPGMEYIRLTVANHTAIATMVDEVDINTWYVKYPGDLDDEDGVDFADFALFAQQWSQSGESLIADLNDDGEVNALDLSLFCENWLKGK